MLIDDLAAWCQCVDCSRLQASLQMREVHCRRSVHATKDILVACGQTLTFWIVETYGWNHRQFSYNVPSGVSEVAGQA